MHILQNTAQWVRTSQEERTGSCRAPADVSCSCQDAAGFQLGIWFPAPDLVSSSGPGFQLGTVVYSPCIMKYPSTPSRLICSCCRSRKDAARERLPRMSSITSACEPPDTAAIRTSTAASWSPNARIFSLGQWTVFSRQKHGEERGGQADSPLQTGGRKTAVTSERLQLRNPKLEKVKKNKNKVVYSLFLRHLISHTTSPKSC